MSKTLLKTTVVILSILVLLHVLGYPVFATITDWVIGGLWAGVRGLIDGIISGLGDLIRGLIP